MDEEKLKDELVRQVQKLAALLTLYTKTMGVDAYECDLQFMVAEGEARIRLTDARYQVDTATGKLTKLPSGEGPHASTLDDAEARRQKGDEREPEDAIRPAPKATPEQVVAEMMKRLGLK